MEVVDLKAESHDASIFGWPASYEVVDLGQVMAGVADSMRAMSARTGADSSGAVAAPTDTAKGPSL